jgi:hypothetical protein
MLILLRYVETKYGSKDGDGSYDTSECPIAWFPDGRSIVVRRKDVILRDILPLFGLSVAKFSSLVR